MTFDQDNSVHVSVDVHIRPTITEVVDDSFLARLEVWGGHSSGASKDAEEFVAQASEDDTANSDVQSAPVEEPSS